MIGKNPVAPKFLDKDKQCFCELRGTCVCENVYRNLVAGPGVY